MTPKEEFLEIFQTHIHREGSAELLDYQGSGQSVMEMSHRSKT